MIHLGTVRPGSTIYIPFQTFDSNDPSASVTITGLATTDVEVYKDGSTTQRASDSGYSLLDTDGIDFDTVTGIHGISIDLSDNTTAGFWAAGSQYMVVIASITVDAATINFIPCLFTIGYENAILNTTIAAYTSTDNFTLTAGSADDDAYNGCVLVAHDVASAVQVQIGVVEDYTGSTKTVNLKADPGVFTMTAADNIAIMPPALLPTTMGTTLDVTTTGAAGIDWGNVENKTTANDLSGTDIQLVDTATAVTNGVTLANGAVTDASLAGNMEIVFETDFATNYNTTDNAWVTNGTSFIGTGWNTGKTGYSLTATTGLGNQTADITGNLSGSVGSVTGAVGSVTGAVGSVTGSVGSISGVTFPTNFGDLSVTATTGRVDVAAVAGTAQTAGDIPALVTTVDTVVDGIQTDLDNGTDGLGAIKTAVDGISSAALASGTAQGGTSTTIQLASSETFADDELIGAIVAITGGTGAGQSNIVTDYVGSTDTATVDRTWATTPDNTSTYAVYALGAVTLSAGDIADAVWDEATSGHTTSGTFGEQVKTDIDAILVDTAVIGTASDLGSGATIGDNLADMAGATFDNSTDTLEDIKNGLAAASDAALLQNTTIATLSTQTSFTLTAGSADDDAYNGAIAVITDSATSTQKAVGTVSDYTGSTKTITLAADPAVFTMAAGDTIDLIAQLGSGASAADIADAVWDEAQSGHTSAGTFGEVATEVASILVDTGTTIPGVLGTPAGADLATDIAAIDTVVDAVLVDTGTTIPGVLGTPAGADMSADIAAVKADTAAILTDTGTTLPSTLSGLATSSALATVDTNVDAILVDTGTTIPGVLGTPAGADLATDIAAVKTDSAAILVDTGTTIPGVLGTPAGADMSTDIAAIDTVVDAILVDTGTSGVVVTGTPDVNVAQISGSSTAADNLEASALGIVSGSCEGTPTTTVIQTDLAEATDDHYIGRVIVFTSGDAAGEAADITDYTGSSGTVTVTALTTAPSASDTFVIV